MSKLKLRLVVYLIRCCLRVLIWARAYVARYAPGSLVTAINFKLRDHVGPPDDIMERYEAQRFRDWVENPRTRKFIPFKKLPRWDEFE